jgi:hypothetical protein
MPHESAATAPRTLGFSAPPFHDPFHALQAGYREQPSAALKQVGDDDAVWITGLRIIPASLVEDLAEPEDRCLAEFPGDLVDRAAVPNAVAQARELIEPFGEYLLRAEADLERRPERLVGDCVLQFAEIGILKLSCQGLVMVRVDGRILPSRGLEPVLDPCLDVGWQSRRVAIESVGDHTADAELHFLHLRVELAKLGREVETFLDEQILDRGLDGSLAFCEERLKVGAGCRTRWAR